MMTPGTVTLLTWIIVGAIAGFLGSWGLQSHLRLIGNIVAGIVGALIGGFLFSLIGLSYATGFNILGAFGAIIGAIVLVGALRLVLGSRDIRI